MKLFLKKQRKHTTETPWKPIAAPCTIPLLPPNPVFSPVFFFPSPLQSLCYLNRLPASLTNLSSGICPIALGGAAASCCITISTISYLHHAAEKSSLNVCIWTLPKLLLSERLTLRVRRHSRAHNALGHTQYHLYFFNVRVSGYTSLEAPL